MRFTNVWQVTCPSEEDCLKVLRVFGSVGNFPGSMLNEVFFTSALLYKQIALYYALWPPVRRVRSGAWWW